MYQSSDFRIFPCLVCLASNDIMILYAYSTKDNVGITQPTKSRNPFPSCVGYPKKKKKHSTFHNQIERAISNDDTTTLCSSTDLNGWRILRFQKRVGYGKTCYRRVQNAVFNWDFEVQKGKKSMGILSAAPNKSNIAGPGFTNQRRKLLATFTEVCLPNPLKSLFVVSPVHVVYEVKDARSIPRCLFSSTAYATLSGHLLAGEERVTVVWRKGMGDAVDIEIVSFSRAAPSIGGKLIWPLIGRMQKQFFLSEMDHLSRMQKQ
mmetsp:Transcript_8627/g.14064  ORF Transcript_8627/g.14064 Transcript_8627/m.14064 type:complete len:262 (-) Transcript_8627:24-809(-)